MDRNYLDQLVDDSLSAIFYLEDSDAKKLAKKVEQFIIDENLKQTNPSLGEKMEKLMIQLKIVAFSLLSDQEEVDILKNHYLESFDIDVDMENRIIPRLFAEPYLVRDEPRERLKNALLQNTQKIGDLTIGQWIQEFEKKYPVMSRNLSSSLDFVSSDPNALNLNSQDKTKLKKMLHAYDYLLVTSIPVTEPELGNILKSLPETQEPEREVVMGRQIFNAPSGEEAPAPANKIAAMTIDEALKNYQELGEQIITSMRIRLKNYPEPVRPSINNWLSDYTFTLGFDRHNTIERTNYLFHTENTQKLTGEDRERLSYLLKSFDEKTPVSVNTGTKQIIFPAFTEEKPTPRENVVSRPQIEKDIRPVKPIPTPSSNQNMPRFTVSPDLSSRSRENQSRPMESPRFQAPINKPAINQAPVSNFREKQSFNSAEKEEFAFGKTIQNNFKKPENNVKFSSPQKLPYEKAKENSESAPMKVQPQPISPIRSNNVPPQPQPMRPQFAKPQPISHPQPLIISPVSRNRLEEDKPAPSNVVNLKDM